MAQTLTRILIHAIFSTKERRNLITPDIEPELYAYIGGVYRSNESPLLEIGGIENHVHLLVSQSKNISLSDLMLELKRDSSKWIKTKSERFADFHWQDGYGGFSIGESQRAQVQNYIRTQKQRHARMSFEDELMSIAEKYGVSFDPKFLWS